MKFPHTVLVLLLLAGLTGGCSTVQRGAYNVKRTTANVWNGVFGGKKKQRSTPTRSSGGSRTRSTSENPPTLESTPQEYVGS